MLQRMPISPGFPDPVFGAQAVFRALMDAMARPSSIQVVEADLEPPAPLNRTAAAIVLTLADFETPVWLDAKLSGARPVAEWIRFHTGSRLVEEPGEARFGVAASADGLPDLSYFNSGSQEYPDESTTLVIQVPGFGDGSGPVLSGPGIEGRAQLDPLGLPPVFWNQAIANTRLFPRGVDFVFADPTGVAALPRSTQIEPGE